MKKKATSSSIPGSDADRLLMSPELEGLLDPGDPFGEGPKPQRSGPLQAVILFTGLGGVEGDLLDAGVWSHSPYIKIRIPSDLVGPITLGGQRIEGVVISGTPIDNTSWAGWRPRVAWEGDSYALIIEYVEGAE